MDPLSFALNLPAAPASVSVVRHMLGGVQPAWPVTDAQLHDLQIAVSEACTNVVKHAYDPTAPGIMEVAGVLRDGEIELLVRDSGAGVRDTESPDLAMGLALIKALATRARFDDRPDGGYEVTMVFVLEGGDG